MALKLSRKKKLVILLAIPIVAIIVIVLLLANTPTHRFNNYHVDEEGDVSDKDIDILWVKSSDYGDYVLLEMKVAGKIRNTYRYDISVVAKDIKNEHEEGFIYRCTYFNGSVEQYNFFGRVVNEDALQILFTKSYFDEGIYMIGLEGCTHGWDEEDFCREGMERHNDILKLLPIF
jgi:hypothetical protein